jgi:hypothetical protein
MCDPPPAQDTRANAFIEDRLEDDPLDEISGASVHSDDSDDSNGSGTSSFDSDGSSEDSNG